MHKSRLLVTRYTLQVFSHDMRSKLTLGLSFHKRSWFIFDQLGHATSSQNMFWFLKFIKSNLQIHSLCGEWSFKWGIVHQKIFQEKSWGYLHDDVYRIYSSKTIHNVSSQFISCQKICKKYVSTSSWEFHMQILHL